jgi:16S rRNA (cytosine1402-N4)-methyltransferase
MEYHKPVMLAESLEFLRVKKGGKYLDATLGDGGHTVEMLKLGANVLGIDVNQGSLDRARKRVEVAGLAKNFVWAKGNFKDVDQLAKDKGFDQLDGILFDLGVSTTQLKDERLGLSFNSEYEPDMRLDDKLGVRAFDLVNGLYEKELADMFWEFGEERFAKKFAKEIVKARELERISSAKQLADIARKAFPGYEKGRLHPATRIFMALRIAVNDELESLKSALPRAGRLLLRPSVAKTKENLILPGGRMVVISFHSLEDKIVKELAQGAQSKDKEHRNDDDDDAGDVVLKELTKKPLEPTTEEIAQNPSARSAKMRVFERYD